MKQILQSAKVLDITDLRGELQPLYDIIKNRLWIPRELGQNSYIPYEVGDREFLEIYSGPPNYEFDEVESAKAADEQKEFDAWLIEHGAVKGETIYIHIWW